MGSDDFTWSDLWALANNLPYDDPLLRAINGKDWWWYHPVMDLIAGIYDGMSVLVSVVSRRDGVKRSEIPKPTLRPWAKRTDSEVLKVKAQPLDEIRKRLGWD